MIKLFLSVMFATALMGLVAYGQTSTSSTTVATGANGVTETTTTTTESTGTVTEFTPGHFLFLKTEAAQPVRYKFSKTVTYVTSDGKVIEASKIRKDSKVRVHYIKEGDGDCNAGPRLNLARFCLVNFKTKLTIQRLADRAIARRQAFCFLRSQSKSRGAPVSCCCVSK
jgi:hypothetical protein